MDTLNETCKPAALAETVAMSFVQTASFFSMCLSENGAGFHRYNVFFHTKQGKGSRILLPLYGRLLIHGRQWVFCLRREMIPWFPVSLLSARSNTVKYCLCIMFQRFCLKICGYSFMKTFSNGLVYNIIMCFFMCFEIQQILPLQNVGVFTLRTFKVENQ